MNITQTIRIIAPALGAVLCASTLLSSACGKVSTGGPLVVGRDLADSGKGGFAGNRDGGLGAQSGGALSVRLEDTTGRQLDPWPLGCNDTCVNAAAVAQGGNPPYSYVWSDGATGASREVCQAQSLSVTVTDTAVRSSEFSSDPAMATANVTVTNGGNCSATDGGTLDRGDGGKGVPQVETRELCRLQMQATGSFSGKISIRGSNGLHVAGRDYLVLAGGYAGRLSTGGESFDSAGIQDAFVTKIDSECRPVWTRVYGGLGAAVNFRAVTADADGNIYVAGSITGSAVLGTETVAPPLGETFMGIVMKLDPSGTTQWVRTFHAGSLGTAALQVAGVSLKIDSEDRLILRGWGTSASDLGSGALTNTAHASEFIAMLDKEGRAQWHRDWPGEDTGGDLRLDLAPSPNGTVFVAGRSSEATVELDTNVLTFPNTGWRGYLTEVSSTGQFLQARVLPGHGSPEAGDGPWTQTLAIDQRRAQIIATSIPIETNGPTPFTGFDCSVDKYTDAGEHAWQRRLSLPNAFRGVSIATDLENSVLLASSNSDPLGAESIANNGAAPAKPVLMKWNENGGLRWTTELDVGIDSYGDPAIGTDAAADVYVAVNTPLTVTLIKFAR